MDKIEEAALEYKKGFLLWKTSDELDYAVLGFQAGAEWQKKQSADEAIRFAVWHFTSPGSNEFNKRNTLPIEEATKQMYKLWQKQ